MILRASDVDGRYSDVVVKVTVDDVNDNAPQFSNLYSEVNVRENAPTGHVIARMIASDSDQGKNGEVVYEIEKGGFGRFGINPHTGEFIVTIVNMIEV